MVVLNLKSTPQSLNSKKTNPPQKMKKQGKKKPITHNSFVF